jgi:hypothetical protein
MPSEAKLKRRVRGLAFGCFVLTMAMYMLLIYLLAMTMPDAKSSGPSWLTAFVFLFLGIAIFMVLRPLVPKG